MDKKLVLQVSKAILERLQQQLDDFHAETITLTRDEAVWAVGLVNAAVEQLEKEVARRP